MRAGNAALSPRAQDRENGRMTIRLTWRLLAGAALAILCLAAAPVTRASDAGGPPEMLGSTDPAWGDFLRLEIEGALPAGISSARPVTRAEAAAWVRMAAESGAADPVLLARLRRSFARELRRAGGGSARRETPALVRLASFPPDSSGPLDGAEAELRAGIDARLALRGPFDRIEAGDSTRAGIYAVFVHERWLAMQGDLYVADLEGGRSYADPLVKDTDLVYMLDEAGITAEHGALRARVARTRHRWGPGAWSPLLLGSDAQPVNAVEWQADLPRGIRARAWTGSLNALEQRGVAAHRIEIPLARTLRIALSEGARFRGGIDQSLYLMGVIPYTLVQRLEWKSLASDSLKMAERNNVLATLEAVYAPGRRMQTWIELLVDDIPATSGNSPARLGGRLGWAIAATLGGRRVDASLEGMKIGRYTYAVYYGEDWVHEDRPLGHVLGADVEAWRLDVGCDLSVDHRVEAGFVWINDGAGSLGESWPENPPAQEHPTRTALTVAGPVTRIREGALRWSFAPRDNSSLGVGVTLRRADGETQGRLTLDARVRY